jgi:hypothetical protein
VEDAMQHECPYFKYLDHCLIEIDSPDCTICRQFQQELQQSFVLKAKDDDAVIVTTPQCKYFADVTCAYPGNDCSQCTTFLDYQKQNRLCDTLKDLGAEKCHVVKEVDCKDCDMSRSDYATMHVGRKDDTGKARWDLLPLEPIKELVDVLTFGAKKYGPNNWQTVDDGYHRYYSACMRHLVAHASGELFDPETKLSHLAHAMCNLLFMYELQEWPRGTV